MKNRIIASLALASALIGGGALIATTASAQVRNPGAQTNPNRPGAREKHPELRRALRQLEAAHKSLSMGAHDFGGHRANAEKLAEQAIDEVKMAIKSDKN